MNLNSPFAQTLAREVRLWIKSAIRQGTVKMSVDNLLQCTVSLPRLRAARDLEGAPHGTNCQWAYAQLFRELCSTDPTIRNFTNL
jgi:hypothetical protein